ncbi:hypothetical protein Tco_0268309 [Tanacetum coccineum]
MTEAPAKVYVVGNAGANPDNVVAEVHGKRTSYLSGTYHCKKKLKTVEGRCDLRYVQIVQGLSEVFPEDLPGLPTNSTGGISKLICSKGRVSTEDRPEIRLSPFEGWEEDISRKRTAFRPRYGSISNFKILPLFQEQEEHEKALEDNYWMLFEGKEGSCIGQVFQNVNFGFLRYSSSGHVIDSDGIYVDPAKIESLRMDISKSPTEKIRQIFCVPILALPEGKRSFIEYCDASKRVWALVLIAEGEKKSDLENKSWNHVADRTLVPQWKEVGLPVMAICGL